VSKGSRQNRFVPLVKRLALVTRHHGWRRKRSEGCRSDLDCESGKESNGGSGPCRAPCRLQWVCPLEPNAVCKIVEREPMDLGESDCLIKTRQRDCYPRVSTLCDFCPVL